MDNENLILDDLEKVTGGVNYSNGVPVVKCPDCGCEISLENEMSGGRIRCEFCGHHWVLN